MRKKAQVEAEQGLTSHQTHYTSYRGRVFTHNQRNPANTVKAPKEDTS